MSLSPNRQHSSSFTKQSSSQTPKSKQDIDRFIKIALHVAAHGKEEEAIHYYHQALQWMRPRINYQQQQQPVVVSTHNDNNNNDNDDYANIHAFIDKITLRVKVISCWVGPLLICYLKCSNWIVGWIVDFNQFDHPVDFVTVVLLCFCFHLLVAGFNHGCAMSFTDHNIVPKNFSFIIFCTLMGSDAASISSTVSWHDFCFNAHNESNDFPIKEEKKRDKLNDDCEIRTKVTNDLNEEGS